MSCYVRLAQLLVLSLACSTLVAPAQDGEETARPSSAACSAESRGSIPGRPADEVWLVSTRHLACPTWSDPHSDVLDVRKYEAEQGTWQESSTQEFLRPQSLPTVMYIHGNRVDWNEASYDGWQILDLVTNSRRAPPAVRFVIWTWNSDQIHGPLKDVRAKADRADREAWYLGWFLSQWTEPETPRLLGFSYGARIATGGLHLLGGGTLFGHSLPAQPNVVSKSYRVALLAAAFDCDWLAPGQRHGSATDPVEKLLVLYNPCDPALKYYRRLNRCTGAALGYVGVCGDLSDRADRIEQLNVSSIVGRSHDEYRYFGSPSLQDELGRILFDPFPATNDGH